MRLILICTALFLLAACQQKPQQQPAANQSAAAAAGTEGIKGVHRDNKGKPGPDIAFNDPDGKPVTLANFKGKPVLVNLWASWCAPCVKELPTLDQLARKGRRFRFWRSARIRDRMHPSSLSWKAMGSERSNPTRTPRWRYPARSARIRCLPTSMLFDANGKEVWRYVGDLDWTSSDAAKLLAEAGATPKKG